MLERDANGPSTTQIVTEISIGLANSAGTLSTPGLQLAAGLNATARSFVHAITSLRLGAAVKLPTVTLFVDDRKLLSVTVPAVSCALTRMPLSAPDELVSVTTSSRGIMLRMAHTTNI